MFRKKVFHSCPRCFTPLNPLKMVGTVGICEACGWAGSYRSEGYFHRIEMRVASLIVFCGLIMTTGIALLDSDATKQIYPHVSKAIKAVKMPHFKKQNADPNQ